MKRWMKYSLITCGAIFLFLLASMLIVPWQIKKQGIAWIDSETDRTLSVEKAYFNPFTLTVEINGLKLSEQDSNDLFINFDRLLLSVSSRSLINWALILDRVELDNFHVNLEQFAKQEFNFSDFTRLGDKDPDQPVAVPDKPFYFSLNNIIIENGSVDFTDHTSLRKTPHTIRELNVRIPFFGNIPHLTDEYVEPLLSLLLNGSEIHAEGHLKPFHQSVETTMTLGLDQIDLAFYAYHFPLPLPIEVKSGEIDAEIDLTYRISATEQPKLLLGGELALTQLDLRHKDDSPLFRMPIMILDLDWAEIFQQDFNLFSLDLYRPELFISRDSDGHWSFGPFLPAPATDQEPIEEEGATDFLLLASESVDIHDGLIHFSDQFPGDGFSEEIEQINLSLKQLSTHPFMTTETALSLQTGRGLALTVASELQLNPLLGRSDFRLTGIPLAAYYPYLAEQLTAPVDGVLDLNGVAHFDAQGTLRLEQGALDLKQFSVPFTEEDSFILDTLSISGLSLDLPARQLSISDIMLKDGRLKASLLTDGSLSPLQLVREPAQGEGAVETVTETASEEATTPWHARIDNVAVNNLDILFTDHTRDSAPEILLHQIGFAIQNLTMPESGTSPYSLNFRIADKGLFAAEGTFAHSPLQLQVKSSLKDLALADYNGFLPENLNLTLADGKLHSTLAVELSEEPEKLSGSFQGELALNNLKILDPFDQSPMLTWGALQLSQIEGELAPAKLYVKNIALSDYSANIQITPDGQINLQNVTTAEDADNKGQAKEENTVAESLEERSPPPDIRIDSVTLQGGTVAFSDRHLPTPFSTTMYKLGGRISGLSSDPEMKADVDLRGQLENHSPLMISGDINPLQDDLYADIKLSFEDIDLSPMSSYSGTYVGYLIEKGKLHLNLKYLIEDHKIDADNQIFLDQFTFGDKVESEQATSLPVPLAVALLKDNNGEIHLDVPVNGDLNDPNFSVTGAVFTILKNLLVKAATSPFALLGSLLGGGEDFTSVTFESGLASLSPSSVQKLEKLAQILSERPGLQLEISGFVDAENDPEGYRKEQLRQMMLAAKKTDLGETGLEITEEEPLKIAPDEYSAYLLNVYKEATFPRPRNFIGMLKALPDSEMEKLLLSHIIVGENELNELAKQRAMAARDILTADNEKLRARIFLKKKDIFQAPKEKGTPSRVEFGMSAK